MEKENQLKSVELLENKMFWLKEYCKYHGLIIKGSDILEEENVIGNINFYDEIVTLNNDKYLFKHFANALIENFKLHGENT